MNNDFYSMPCPMQSSTGKNGKSESSSNGSNSICISKHFTGGVVPDLLLFQPDFLDNKEEWPFFRGDYEYVIDICAAYVFLSNAVNELVNK